MDRALEEKLVKDFPLTFFRDSNGREPWSMFGIETGNGWEPIIRKGAEKLEPLLVAAKAAHPKDYEYGYLRTTQLKEKYGTMRWYTSGVTDEMQKIISQVEKQSRTTCEQCGKKGKLRGRGWLYTACYEHAKPEDRTNLELLQAKHEKNLKKEKRNVKTKN